MRRRRRIDPTADRPVYKQVADDIRDQIRLGALTPGAQLPAEPRIAEEYGVGANTVRSALAVLRAERLIVTEHGTGSRVREQEERADVTIPPGARVTIRPADVDECRRFGLAPGDPVVVIETSRDTEVLPAYRVTLVAEAGQDGSDGPAGE